MRRNILRECGFGTSSVHFDGNWQEMALLLRKDELPDPQGMPVSTVASQTIMQVN